jgi:hypothetical protein
LVDDLDAIALAFSLLDLVQNQERSAMVGLLSIIRKAKRKERSVRVLMLSVARSVKAPDIP